MFVGVVSFRFVVLITECKTPTNMARVLEFFELFAAKMKKLSLKLR